jgi:hydrogenase maturation protease
MSRVLVACVGNVLRRDDGFGPAVAARLEGKLPEGAALVETGIGGIALVQELLAGCDGLVLVDAIDQGGPPGTLFRVEPEVGEAVHVPDVHLANPERVLAMAKAMDALPSRVVIVGCQPADVDELGEGLSAPVAAALEQAVEAVHETVRSWLREDRRARV